MVLALRKTCKALPLLLACILMLASVVCLAHADAPEDAHGTHAGDHHTTSSSTSHLSLDVHCLVATLPASIALACCALALWHSLTYASVPVVVALPPFIPPKRLRHV